MTPAFKVGEIAIGCNMQFDTAYNGMECEILEFRAGATVMHPHMGIVTIDAYFVRFEDGCETNVIENRLRKKRPPESDDAAARQAMLDCIERARLPQGVPA